MGFKIGDTRKRYRLVFEDPALAGLEIVMSALTIGELKRLVLLHAAVRDDEQDTAEQLGELLTLFAGHVIEWNLTDNNNQALKPSVEALEGLDVDFVMFCTEQWQKTVMAVPTPLDGGSNSGSSAALADIPMTVTR